MSRTLVTALLVATGCYDSVMPTPKIAAPTLVDNEPVEVDLRSVRYWSDSSLRYLNGNVIHRMTYAGHPVTYGQVRALADPSWSGKLAEHEQLVDQCHAANIPRYIGYGSIVLGGAAYGGGGVVFGDNSTLQSAVGLGLIGLGVLAYATGYLVFGGRHCAEADTLAHTLHLGDAGNTELANDATIDEVTDVVKEFNKRMVKEPQASE